MRTSTHISRHTRLTCSAQDVQSLRRGLDIAQRRDEAEDALLLCTFLVNPITVN